MESYFDEFYCRSRSFEDGGLHQGAIYLYPQNPKGEYTQELGIIIITNECDFVNKAAMYVSYIPIFSSKLFLNGTQRNLKRRWKKMIPQNHLAYFYLAPHDKHSALGSVALFQDIRSLKIEEFKNNFYFPPVLRLSETQRNKLSAKIARLFNRIPIDHPKENVTIEWIEENIISQKKNK